MDLEFIENIVFEDRDFTEEPLAKAEYYNCSFIRCNLSKTDSTDFLFEQCSFTDCDLSGIKVRNCTFSEGSFMGCKMIGVDFTNVNNMSFSMSWSGCILDFSLFSAMRLKQIHFESCHLEEVDFSESDMTEAIFEDCRLSRAVFDQTNLTKANFQTAYDFTIDIDKNMMKGAVFSKDNTENLLRKYGIVVK